MSETLLSEYKGREDCAEQVANEVLNLLSAYPVLLLEGELGSGKTTFCKILLQKAGYKGGVNSPTFNIVNEYKLHDGSRFYHFDLYRIKYPEELIETGFEEYLESGFPCLIEWPEAGSAFYNMPLLILKITYAGDERIYRLYRTTQAE